MKNQQQKIQSSLDLPQLSHAYINSNTKYSVTQAHKTLTTKGGHFSLLFQYVSPSKNDLIKNDSLIQTRTNKHKTNFTYHTSSTKIASSNSDQHQKKKSSSSKCFKINDLSGYILSQQQTPKQNQVIQLNKLNVFESNGEKNTDAQLFKKYSHAFFNQSSSTKHKNNGGQTERYKLKTSQKDQSQPHQVKSLSRNKMLKSYLEVKQRFSYIQFQQNPNDNNNDIQISTTQSNFFKRNKNNPKKIAQSLEQQELLQTNLNLQEILFQQKKDEIDTQEKLQKCLAIQTMMNNQKQDQDSEELKHMSRNGSLQIQQYSQMMKSKTYRMLVEEGKNKILQHLKADFRIVRIQLIKNLQFMKRLKLTPKTLMTEEVFSYKPFQKKGSHELMQACKANNFLQAQELIKNNRFLVYDFDYIQLTPLHWVCKRGHYETAKILLNSGADVDAQDLIGRTPLYFAIETNSFYVVQLLLENSASPWSTDTTNYNEIGQNKKLIMKLLNKSRKLHILMRMTPPAIRDELWQTNIKSKLKVN